MKRNPLAGLGLFDKSFWRILLPLALPIALQNLLMTSFRLVDTLMIGRLGDVSIAAVGLAGQASFLVELVAFGMASGSAVFIAQYHGAGDLDGIRRTFGATILFGFPFGLIATLVCLLFPEEIMVLFTDDPALIAEGARYLEYACWSYLALAVYQSMCTTLRSTERVRLPMISSGICAVANAVLNYLFIFGCPGLEPMGVAGAGLATAITSLMNPLIIYVVSLVQRNILIAPARQLFALRGFLGTYWKRVLPVLCNEMFWSLSIVALNMVFGRMGSDNYAALTVVRTIENIVFVFFVGICSACNILVGKAIGEGTSKDRVYSLGWCLLLVSLLLGGALAVCLALALPLVFIPYLYPLFSLSELATEAAVTLCVVYLVLLPLKSFDITNMTGVLRAGGDVRAATLIDLGPLWLVAVPLAAVTALVLNAPLPLICLGIYSENIVKTPLGIWRLRSRKWINDVTDVST